MDIKVSADTHSYMISHQALDFWLEALDRFGIGVARPVPVPEKDRADVGHDRAPTPLGRRRILEMGNRVEADFPVNCDASVPSLRSVRAVTTADECITRNGNISDGIVQPCLLEHDNVWNFGF